jgi:hypothetical protein
VRPHAAPTFENETPAISENAATAGEADKRHAELEIEVTGSNSLAKRRGTDIEIDSPRQVTA